MAMQFAKLLSILLNGHLQFAKLLNHARFAKLLSMLLNGTVATLRELKLTSLQGLATTNISIYL